MAAMTRRGFIRGALPAAVGLSLAQRPSALHAAPRLEAQRLGWAGVRLRLGKASLYIDPLVDSAVWGGALQSPLVPIEGSGDSGSVLITHRHPDHCDPIAIKQLVGANGALVSTHQDGYCTIPAGIRVRLADLYEPQLLGDFTAVAVPAVDGYGDPQVSWIVMAGGRKVIHCGDTLWHGHWWQIGRAYGPFDAAFLPINGARFGWRQPVSDVPAVMTPEQAVAAAVVLGARRLVPIHYGMSASKEYTEIPDLEKNLLAEGVKRSVEVRILEPGAWLGWD
jgi:L-ascorbate metabolism protein UlaG (beta-lactamase superfamily)